MSRYLIRAYRPGDEDGVCALFAQVFGKALSRAQWQWKLHTLPSPAENEWVAEADGRIVGHYAVQPIRFKLRERKVVVPHGCDAMTHPDWRRQGILSALGEHANEVWQASGAPFQIGFHYGGWGSVRARLGWRPAARLVLLRHVLQPMALLARRLGLRVNAPDLTGFRNLSGLKSQDDICVTNAEHIGDEFNRLWQKLSGNYTYCAVRDRAWVQWRYLDMPDVEQRILLATRAAEPLGYLAYRIQRDGQRTRAALLDCFIAREDHSTLRALMCQLRRELTALSVESVVALAVKDSSLYRGLRQLGFWPSRHGFDFSIIPYTAVDLLKQAADIWFVSGAEGDVV